MASAGMGDVLAGTVAGMLASNGLTRIDARYSDQRGFGQRGCLHSACADELVAEKGVRGLLASDLAEHLPAMFYWRGDHLFCKWYVLSKGDADTESIRLKF